MRQNAGVVPKPEKGAPLQGFIDAHVHLIPGGLSLVMADLSQSRSRAEFRAIVQKAAGVLRGCTAPQGSCRVQGCASQCFDIGVQGRNLHWFKGSRAANPACLIIASQTTLFYI